ncbi:putative periplasmic solute-binding protein [Halobacteroides halobius DSM 5150]|uniref:Putative periplasmic solute-binding protein n=1 Tax=Halobacteroides halobius (strain ATCC 35273 / DSM 5150 / MD-1) TaxID=748449 RepID=L0K5V1_HALHC|nr:periplasmic solute-binding protein [Halobacteroides halobius]AGB40657.1 putative periplasmic solute-binding protein [Halobacteroides halobius DSM 5150]
MLRHILLGVGITLIVVALVLMGVNVAQPSFDNSKNRINNKRQTIIKEARKLGMAFPGENYQSGISLEQNIDLEKVISSLAKEKSKQSNSVKDHLREIIINIPQGMNGRQVAGLLVSKGLLKNKTKFIKTLNKFNIENKIMAGRYTFSSQASFIEILLVLIAPKEDIK